MYRRWLMNDVNQDFIITLNIMYYVVNVEICFDVKM